MPFSLTIFADFLGFGGTSPPPVRPMAQPLYQCLSKKGLLVFFSLNSKFVISVCNLWLLFHIKSKCYPVIGYKVSGSLNQRMAPC